MQSSSVEDVTETSEIEDDELQLLNRDVDDKIIIRFRFHPDNYYEKQNGI